MNFNMIKPCDNCPFRTDCLEGWLGAERAEEIATSLERATFPCHKTTVTNDEEDWDRVETENSSHCAGALILMGKLQQPSQMMRIAERLNLYDYRKLKMDSPVFDTFEDFIEHHA